MKRTLFIALILFLAGSLYSQEKKGGTEKKSTGSKSAIPEGYGNLKWGVTLGKAKEGIAGKLAFTDEKTEIISRDGNLEYQYGFFYIDPAVTAMEKGDSGQERKGGADEKDEGVLYFVSLKFPYLLLKEVRDKIEEKYGPSTNEYMSKGRGAIAWDSEKSLVVMWVDKYGNNSYCRRITYLSKDIAKDLNKYQTRVFNKNELELIRKLNP